MCCDVISYCQVYAEVKPRWINCKDNYIINSTAPWQCISIDFMTNRPSGTGLTNVFTVVDKFSHYPFAFPTKDHSSMLITVIQYLKQLFTLFGPLKSIHSDNEAEFLSDEFKSFLAS